MARISGVAAQNASLFVRFVYWMTKRKLGRVVMPVKIHAHHPRLLRSMGKMEQGLAAAKSVDAGLKSLAELRVSTLIGCPF